MRWRVPLQEQRQLRLRRDLQAGLRSRRDDLLEPVRGQLQESGTLGEFTVKSRLLNKIFFTEDCLQGKMPVQRRVLRLPGDLPAGLRG